MGYPSEIYSKHGEIGVRNSGETINRYKFLRALLYRYELKPWNGRENLKKERKQMSAIFKEQ